MHREMLVLLHMMAKDKELAPLLSKGLSIKDGPDTVRPAPQQPASVAVHAVPNSSGNQAMLTDTRPYPVPPQSQAASVRAAVASVAQLPPVLVPATVSLPIAPPLLIPAQGGNQQQPAITPTARPRAAATGLNVLTSSRDTDAATLFKSNPVYGQVSQCSDARQEACSACCVPASPQHIAPSSLVLLFSAQA